MITDNFETASISLKGMERNLCWGGGVWIKRVTEKEKVNYPDLENDLLNIENKVSRAENYKSWKLNFLTDAIFYLYHNYEEDNILLIQQYSSRALQASIFVNKFNLNKPNTDIHHFHVQTYPWILQQ